MLCCVLLDLEIAVVVLKMSNINQSMLANYNIGTTQILLPHMDQVLSAPKLFV